MDHVTFPQTSRLPDGNYYLFPVVMHLDLKPLNLEKQAIRVGRRSSTWKVTTIVAQALQAFINSCLRRPIGVPWPDTITNE